MKRLVHNGGTGVRAATAAVLAAIAVGGALTAATLTASPETGRIDAQRAQIRALEAEIVSIDSQAQAAASQAAAATARLEEAEADLAANAKRLRQAKKDLGVARGRLTERLVALYKDEPPSFVEVLLASGELSSALDTQSELERVGAQDQRALESVRVSRARLAEARKRLDEEREAAEADAREAATRKAALDDLIGQRRAVLDQAQSTLSTLVAAEEQRRRMAALAAAQAEEEARLRDVAAGETPAGGSGGGGTPEPATAPAVSTDPETPAQSSPAPNLSPDVSATLDRIAQCESGGDPTAVSPDGQYRGKYQFHPDTWAALGGQGDPAAAPESEQDRLAAILLRQQGASPWPVCGA